MISFLRDRLWQSLIGVGLVLVVMVFWLFQGVLDIPVLGGTKTVKVELASTGGLYEGSSVTYRGVKVGKIRKLRLTPTGVEASAFITSKDHIPAHTVAKVRSLSPVGEQYLDLQPKSSSGPWLHDGSVIPAESTDLPKTLASTVIAVNKVLDQIDAAQLHTTLSELSTALAGTGQDIGRMVDQGSVLLAELDRLWPETDRLLTNGQTVLDIGTAKADDIRQLATSSRQFAAFLKAYDPEFRKTLHDAPGQVRQLQALVKDAGTILPGFLGTAVRFTELLRPYHPHIAALLANYAPGLGVLARAISNGQFGIDLIPQDTTRCSYGTARRDPRDATRRPLVTTGHCPSSHARLQRGAAHAPGPVG